jgi:hypothetical protein
VDGIEQSIIGQNAVDFKLKQTETADEYPCVFYLSANGNFFFENGSKTLLNAHRSAYPFALENVRHNYASVIS